MGTFAGASGRNTFTIIPSAGANGSISPSWTSTIASGGTKVYNITPNTGYKIATLAVDGENVSLQNSSYYSYTFINVSADHTIAATFARADSATPAPSSPVGGATATRPSITVTSPALGETLIPGQPYTIRWSSRNLPLNARIHISIMNGTRGTISDPNTTIVTGLRASATSYTWVVSPNNTGWGVGMASPLQRLARLFGNVAYAAGDPDQYIIGVGANLGEGTEEIAYATSSIFRISSTPTPGTASSPTFLWTGTSGRTTHGVPFTIEWKFSNVRRSCNIQYTMDNGRVWHDAATGTTTSPGSFSNITPGIGEYTLRAVCDGTELGGKLGHTVAAAGSVATPSTGTGPSPIFLWTGTSGRTTHGVPFTIEWNFNNARSCNIQYSMDNGQTWTTAATATTTSPGSFSDITPATGTYQLRALCDLREMPNTLTHTVVAAGSSAAPPTGGTVTTIPTTSLRANGSVVTNNSTIQPQADGSIYFVWGSSGATSCALNGSPINTSGSQSVQGPPAGSYKYVCNNGRGLDSAPITFTIRAVTTAGSFASDTTTARTQVRTGNAGDAPNPNILSFAAPGGNTTAWDKSFTLDWLASAALSCAIDYSVDGGGSWSGWRSGLDGTGGPVTVPAMTSPTTLALKIRLICNGANGTTPAKQIIDYAITASASSFASTPATTQTTNTSCTPVSKSIPIACSTIAGQYPGLSSNQTVNTASDNTVYYTEDSCTGAIAYDTARGGCSAPTTATAPTCSLVSKFIQIACSAIAGQYPGLSSNQTVNTASDNTVYYTQDSCSNAIAYDTARGGCSAPVSMNSGNSNANQLASAAGAVGGLFGALPSKNNTGFNYTWNRDLQIGSPYTNDIVALQTALTHEGVYAGDITGGFYDQTYLAVKKFQRKYGIESTGFVGPQTRTKLNELYSK